MAQVIKKVGATKPVELVQWATVRDGKGDAKESITKTVKCFAEVIRKSGTRQLQDGQYGLINKLSFRVYFKPNVYPTGNWRVIYAGRTHQINEIVRVDENRFYWDFIAVSQDKR